ncbi:hypothetical protein NDNC_0410 [Candidatus Nasuia deltocephalinicola]|uniref:Uncharacterized protein n=1 Tax=Candidatus Nasuia deltocephalincola TaxID=1160784 RepID=A0A974WPM1_9PROT|nr:hypothetical protein CU086_00705 [Candidatus Nasuia deltocephalinicola]BEH03875.1 hypothetical protein NDNC_0410 [Candidatus Nasuia deltocephalinicola]
MFKLIILPNNFNFLNGFFIKLNNFFIENLFEIINKIFKIKGYCGGFGKCKMCFVNIKEGFLKNDKFILSCQQNYIFDHLIIDLIN